MRSKFLLIVTVFAVLALGLSACAGVQTRQENPRTLSVTGTGMVTITPDIAYINIGVHTEDPSAANAVSSNNAQTQKVIDSLVASGVAKEDIRTTNFSIWPNQHYDSNNQPTGITYAVDNTVYVTVRDLSKMGTVLDTVIKAGANNISSISFDLADKTAEMTKARDLAVKNAKDQAAELAKSAGVTLGDIQTVTSNESGVAPYMDFGKGGGGAAPAASVPINPGTMQLSTTVSITYFLK